MITAEDIERHLLVSPTHSLCIAIDPAPEFPGYVRSTYLFPLHRVRVEYEVHGLDEGGVYYEAHYGRAADAIEALARFTGVSPETWSDLELSGYYPEKPIAANLADGHAALKRAIETQSVPLPDGAAFVLQGTYWKQFENSPNRP